MPSRVYRERKNVLLKKWAEFQQNEIDSAIDQFKPRLHKPIEVEGKHIQQFLGYTKKYQLREEFLFQLK